MVRVNRIINELDIVLSLAEQNALDPDDCESSGDHNLIGEAMKQQKAIAGILLLRHRLDLGSLWLVEKNA